MANVGNVISGTGEKKSFGAGLKDSLMSGVSNVVGGFPGFMMNLVSSWIGNKQRRNMMDYEAKLQRDQFDYQTAVTRQLRDEDREYNDPAAVARRARAAGFNLAAGEAGAPLAPSQAAAPGGMPSIAASSYPSISVSPLENAQANLANAQAEQIRSQTPGHDDFLERYGLEIEGLRLGNKGQDLKNRLDAVDLRFRALMHSASLDKSAAEVRQFNAYADKALQEAANLLDIHKREPLVRAQLEKEIDMLVVQKAYTEAKTRLTAKQGELMDAQIYNLFAQSNNLEEALKQMRLDTRMKGFEVEIAEVEKAAREWKAKADSDGWGKAMHRIDQLATPLGKLIGLTAAVGSKGKSVQATATARSFMDDDAYQGYGAGF